MLALDCALEARVVERVKSRKLVGCMCTAMKLDFGEMWHNNRGYGENG